MYKIRETITFDGKMYNIQHTMNYFRTLFTHDLIEIEYYQAIMSTLVELRSGYPYEADEFMNAPDGGYATLDRFFLEYGALVTGGAAWPIDLTVEDEIEEETNIIDDDLISEVTFFTEIDEIDIMNDDIGEFEPLDEVEIEKFTW